MRAVTAEDGAVAVADLPEPTPGHGELLVGVRAAGLNAADLLQVRGLYPAPPGAPADVLGLELAGEVVAAGPGVTRWRAGDRVMAVVGGGGQAELAVVPESCALPLPEGVPWEQAGGFPEAFTTAHDALFTQCALATGERLLVHGAAGGVGTAAVQLGRAAGCSVSGTVRRPDLRAAVASLGAQVLAPDGFEGSGPFDVVLELVGAPNIPGDLACLATGGRIAVIGIAAGRVAEVDLWALMGRRARICGSTLRSRSLEGKAAAAAAVEAHVLPLLATGAVRVPVAATFPLGSAPAAYERFGAGAKLGKIVLVID